MLQPRYLLAQTGWRSPRQSHSTGSIPSRRKFTHTSAGMGASVSIWLSIWLLAKTHWRWTIRCGRPPTNRARVADTEPFAFNGLPALLNHGKRLSVSHRLINTITAHVKTPINFQQWLSAALLILCLWLGTRSLAKGGQSSHIITAFPNAVGLLWALGSVSYFIQVQALTTPLIRTTQGTMDSLIDGSHLAPLATQISATHGASDRAVISVGIDEQGRFDAQRLPFMLLPLQVISVNRVQLKRMSPERWGTVVILGQESPRRRQAINRVINSSDLTIISEEENTILLSMRPNEGGKQ